MAKEDGGVWALECDTKQMPVDLVLWPLRFLCHFHRWVLNRGASSQAWNRAKRGEIIMNFKNVNETRRAACGLNTHIDDPGWVAICICMCACTHICIPKNTSKPALIPAMKSMLFPSLSAIQPHTGAVSEEVIRTKRAKIITNIFNSIRAGVWILCEQTFWHTYECGICTCVDPCRSS